MRDWMTKRYKGLIIPLLLSFLFHSALIFALSEIDLLEGDSPGQTSFVVSLQAAPPAGAPKAFLNSGGLKPSGQIPPAPASQPEVSSQILPSPRHSTPVPPVEKTPVPPVSLAKETAPAKQIEVVEKVETAEKVVQIESVEEVPLISPAPTPQPQNLLTMKTPPSETPNSGSAGTPLMNVSSLKQATDRGVSPGSPSATEASGRLQASFGDTGGPRILFMPELRYPVRARRLNLEGQVQLLLDLDSSGRLEKASILQGAGQGFDEVALKAVSRARFAPAELHGRHVACQVILPVSFRLNSPR